MSRRATVIGAGLIGGSVGIALRKQGWAVSVVDRDPEVATQAIRVGAADEVGLDPASELVVIATPVGVIPELALDALERCPQAAVTDVGSTKADICEAVSHTRFVGGHPMAGSEQDGLAGAREDMFAGAMWVLTPTETTDEDAFATVRAMVRSIGAETIALPPDVHDELVAQVSHVPHLTAASLMNLADASSVEHRALLRLAAGGFRDMTRISAGRPSIWPDICLANSRAIVEGLDRLIEALSEVRDLVANRDRDGILTLLTRARAARINLPVGFGPSDNLVELAVAIPDRPGEIAAIATLASELDVNIFDLELSHSGEGRQGVMIMVVDESRSERFMGGLMARGYRPAVRSLG
ncbi:MAG: prephenate dehydrogenase/arogenate dehydrogenase family protein [Acidimicrobiia bacterium]|nr:prephenate dehydrogenase/arogenate dehydrogenase family protein [Acidimicrobiia bacterium]